MAAIQTPAIVLRRTAYGESDLILALLTPLHGRLALMVKGARRSRRRFAGTLELFSLIAAECSAARRPGDLGLLREAVLREPFDGIRSDIDRTAQASYWAELVDGWVHADQAQQGLFDLCVASLDALARGQADNAVLSLFFQLHFMDLAGLAPQWQPCCVCRQPLTGNGTGGLRFNVARGGVVCNACGTRGAPGLALDRGTAMHLRWLQEGDVHRARRTRLSPRAAGQAQRVMEAFVPHHLGREPRSLAVIRQLRRTPRRSEPRA